VAARSARVLACAAAFTAAGAVAALPLAAQESADASRTHVVRTGDTLWDLARSYLSDPYLWPEIFRLNTDVVSNPHRIFPNERLRIPGTVGSTAGAEMDARAGAATDGIARSVFYREDARSSAAGNQVRFETAEEQPAFPEGVYVASGVLAGAGEVTPLGRVSGVVEETVVPLRLSGQIQPHMRVKVALPAGSAIAEGEELQFVRAERQIKPYGTVYLPTGAGRVESVTGPVATVLVERLFGAMQVGDVAVAAPVSPLERGSRAVAEAGTGMEARVVAFAEPHPLPSTEDRVFLDVGRRAGTREGDEYEAYIPARVERGESHPEVVVARLQVVRTMEQTATARVTELRQPALEAGMRVRRVARMP
jgi:hypothetical protein